MGDARETRDVIHKRGRDGRLTTAAAIARWMVGEAVLLLRRER